MPLRYPSPPPLTSDSPSEPPQNNTRKDHAHHALAAHGNYRNYYFHRAASIPDARLSLLSPFGDPGELFQDRAILDLGCNVGKLTIECITHLGASRVVGIDLDDVLIERAKERWREASRSFAGVGEDCVFVCQDFMAPHFWSSFTSLHGEFDTILLLSITKWLHLHHGDEGLVSLFRDLFKLLPEGGTLVVEPQEWANYKRAVSKNPSLKPVYRVLEMRPNFENELRDVGFRLENVIEREEGGFSRPLMLWTKLVNTL
jgi:7SK snRNA methylphosphate capping enzyme